MSEWVIVLNESDPYGVCANERIDLALGALAMGDEVLLVLAEQVRNWSPKPAAGSDGPSAVKRIRQVTLYGGELVWLGAPATDTLANLPVCSLAEVARRVQQADRVLT